MFIKHIKKSFVLFLSFLLITQSLLAAPNNHAEDVTGVLSEVAAEDISLYLSTNAKIYFAQYLLMDKKNWKVAYEILRDVIRNDQSLSDVVVNKIDKAADIIREYQFKKVVNSVMAIQYKQRPYVRASMLLSEALMDSRIDINVPNDTEIIFVEKLLKNYFSPGHPERVNIIYPSVEEYAFAQWALTDENLKKARIAPSNEKDGVINQLLESSKDRAITPVIPGPQMPQTPGGIPQIPVARKDGQKVQLQTGEEITIPGNTIPQFPRLFVELKPEVLAAQSLANDSTRMIGPEDIKALGMIVDSGIEVAENVAQLQQNYEKLRERVSNEYLNEAMLMQIIADPGAVVLDPQLQAFAKKVRIEINLGKVESPSAIEVANVQQVLEENIVEVGQGGSSYSINLSKLYGITRHGTYSNLELKYATEKGNLSQSTLMLISSLAGEDLLFLRLLANSTVTAGPILNTLSATSKLSSSWLNKNVIDKLIQSGIRMKMAAGEGGAIIMPRSPIVPIVPNMPPATTIAGQKLSMLGRLYIAFTERLNGIKSPVEKIVNAEFTKAAVDRFNEITHGKIVEMIKNGTMFYLLIGLNVFAEATVGALEYANAKTTQDKRDVRDETLARMGGSLLYAVPGVGVITGFVDLSHLFFRLPVEGTDLFFLARSLGQRAALLGSEFNPTSLQLREYELSLNLPREANALDRYTKNINDIGKAQTQLAALSNEVQNIVQSYLSLLYKGHRHLSRRIVDHSMYDFGEQIENYIEQFEDNLKTFAKDEKIISSQMLTLLPAVQ
ncbi:MAG: hypothetical protein A2504_02495 [Bdellovibrionales bacterium RIFOXYD12_FULL_39_22]|nr:MAG: hypothetical protein A2385_12525 [Bdellovibrionales bacterium RIFOXYB1_FULL_39_21]OFZ41174.1 MAG: hypothetical protein A2485_00935 [Bdellovibrionales bacterium RIFOXYC12_FULL_39_17]OFZ44928.1 MAG: hypothetical protein A2404_11680 [Bdellovibrionales bacterium RIFOXYC1_FULL_39_130]OFZ74375.1 MAG: hypothetical protein A2560_12050 [Bdellovibrionales bacterium RIFOXYD1_FULL_39_84]OFZ92377.1 MAG: hypothetical protein A2504_02495 [Bdellovibrionales bacterium RIFOXYD12_FULL_39_22]HLE10704.1 hy